LAVCRALFPGDTVTARERLTISGCLALAILVVLGLVLNALPDGLDAQSWRWSLIAVTLGASVTALTVGRWRGKSTESSAYRRPAVGTVYGCVAAVVLLGGGLVLARQSALTHDQATRFTQLWTLPGARPGEVAYGVTNDQGRTQRYELRASVRGRRKVFFRSGWFNLAAGRSRTGTLTLPLTKSRMVRFDLFEPGAAAPYRSTKLLVR
jgi:hypothetical protein